MHVGDDVDWLQMERTMPTDAAPPIGQIDAPVIDRLWNLALTRKGNESWLT